MREKKGFLRRGPISPRVHGTLDYPLAATLIAGPRVLGFEDRSATAFARTLGGAATLLAIGTAWSRGIVRVLPPPVHGIADIGATSALIAAPFVFGYTDDRSACVFSVIVGAGGLVVTLLTRFESDLKPGAPVVSLPVPG